MPRPAAVLLLFAACAAPPSAVADEDATARREIQAVVDAVYASVSGAKGEARDWAGLEARFADGGALTVVARDRSGAVRHRTLTPGEFVQAAARASQDDSFYEAPMATRIERFGGVASAFSSYTARRAPTAAPFARGVNTFTLVQTAAGWRIAAIAWCEEAPGWLLPPDLIAGDHTDPETKS